MAKARIKYVCSECGYDSPQYYGRCPGCMAWNTLQETIEQSTLTTGPRSPRVNTTHPAHHAGQPVAAVKLSQIANQKLWRMATGYGELDRVLGGGLVPGSLVLIGGEPGIGKSTLLLQVANQLAQGHRVLYVAAEESGQQVKLRSQRLLEAFSYDPDQTNPVNIDDDLSEERAIAPDLETATKTRRKAKKTSDKSIDQLDDSDVLDKLDQLYLLAETDLEAILGELASLKPAVAVIDSIQNIYFATLSSAPGSVAQVRECTSALMQVAKRQNITLLIVGHVTKDGTLAGPKVLEHLVDTVLYFEGDRFASHRLLRSMKNRFGATQEIGVFEMMANGLTEVTNPSELFLGNRDDFCSGTCTIVALEGTRPLLVELQALVSPASHGSPRRSTTGLDNARLQQILAVLEKRVGIPLSKLDAYVATVGGLVVEEPAADLGVAVAVVASFRDRVVDPGTILIGEVGLGGQVRPVSQLELRLREAAKLGFQRAIIPKGQQPPDVGIELISVGKVIDAIVAAMPHQPTSQPTIVEYSSEYSEDV
jgi:DNA repair protein RadA/Sms